MIIFLFQPNSHFLQDPSGAKLPPVATRPPTGGAAPFKPEFKGKKQKYSAFAVPSGGAVTAGAELGRNSLELFSLMIHIPNLKEKLEKWEQNMLQCDLVVPFIPLVCG